MSITVSPVNVKPVNVAAEVVLVAIATPASVVRVKAVTDGDVPVTAETL